jgi:hypothetical protein
MRFASAGLVLLLAFAAPADDAPAKRFGVAPDLKTFPQATPEECLGSILKAIEMKRADYILAQLADPEFVDRRIKETSYDELLGETKAKLVSDPGAAKLLRRFLVDDVWTVEDDTAIAGVAEGRKASWWARWRAAAIAEARGGTDRLASFRKIDGRWYLKQSYKRPLPKTERE